LSCNELFEKHPSGGAFFCPFGVSLVHWPFISCIVTFVLAYILIKSWESIEKRGAVANKNIIILNRILLRSQTYALYALN